VADRLDLIVEHGTLVSESAMYGADVGVVAGRIAAIAAPGGLNLPAERTLDASGRFILPGVIDGHVHFREPGLEYKEDFSSGSRAAVMGGVTTVLEMPNTRPPTASAALVEAKRELAEAKAYCDFGLYGLLAQDNVDQLAPMARAGVVGYKCFLGESTGTIPPPDNGTLLEALEAVRALGLRVGFHAEDNQILQHLMRRRKAEGRTDPLAHLDSRPWIAEVEAIQRVALFADYTGARIHIFHLSSSQGLAAIAAWRARGVDITTEVTAHHAWLTADDAQRVGNLLRINPPVRERGHGEVLLAALADGRIDAIATDHAPHTLAEKRGDDVWEVTSGFVGVETSVALFLSYGVNAGRMTLPQFVRAASTGPARVWRLYPRKGVLQVGADADLTIVDLDRPGTIEAARLHGKNNPTPFDGFPLTAQPVATIVRGELVMLDGELVGAPRGRLVRPVG
jgi:dihydroorotase